MSAALNKQHNSTGFKESDVWMIEASIIFITAFSIIFSIHFLLRLGSPVQLLDLQSYSEQSAFY